MRQWALWTTLLSVLSHAFVNASTEDAAVTSLGKLCVCQIAGMSVFSSYSLHDVCQEMQKQSQLKSSSNCLEVSQNITYSLQIQKNPSAHFYSINTANRICQRASPD